MVIYKLGINLRSFKYRIRSQISATFFSRNKEVENTGISISQFNLHLVNNDLDHALSSTFPLSLSPLCFFFCPGPERITHISHWHDPPDDIRQRGVAMFPVSTSVISIVTRTEFGRPTRETSSTSSMNDVTREWLFDKCSMSARSVEITILDIQRYSLNCTQKLANKVKELG